MAHWMTIEEISERYAVGERRLLEFSHRGNLSMRRMRDGVVMFDEDSVARIFRRRGEPAPSGARLGAANLGVLGTSRLGVEPAPIPVQGAREVRRREMRLLGEPAPVQAPRRAVG